MSPKKNQPNEKTNNNSDAAVVQTTNVLLSGVGGQGVLVGSEALALAAIAEGLEAKQSEVHGVAQRGGSVVSHVRFGPRVNSPLITCGEVDILYSIERLEALRFAHYLKNGGLIVMDDHAIKPITMPGQEGAVYPENVPEFLIGKGYDVHVVPAVHIAVELGNKRCTNVVLLGALSTHVSLSDASWQTALERRFPKKILDLNLRAFEAGRKQVASASG